MAHPPKFSQLFEQVINRITTQTTDLYKFWSILAPLHSLCVMNLTSRAFSSAAHWLQMVSWHHCAVVLAELRSVSPMWRRATVSCFLPVLVTCKDFRVCCHSGRGRGSWCGGGSLCGWHPSLDWRFLIHQFIQLPSVSHIDHNWKNCLIHLFTLNY